MCVCVLPHTHTQVDPPPRLSAWKCEGAHKDQPLLVCSPLWRGPSLSRARARASRYKIDWETNIATVAWQFEFDVDSSATNTIETLETNDLFVTDGGSITPWEKDFLYVAFTVTDAGSSTYVLALPSNKK